MKRSIPQGQYIAPIHAAQSFVGSRYSIEDDEGGAYSAHPGDYWAASDSAVLGALVGPITLRTVTGRTVTTRRVLKEQATVRDLRRLSAAVVGMVRP